MFDINKAKYKYKAEAIKYNVYDVITDTTNKNKPTYQYNKNKPNVNFACRLNSLSVPL